MIDALGRYAKEGIYVINKAAPFMETAVFNDTYPLFAFLIFFDERVFFRIRPLLKMALLFPLVLAW